MKKIELLVFILFFTLFTTLGVWQLQRAREKQTIEDQINARGSSELLPVEALLERDPDSIEYRKTRVTGRWQSAGQLLIDNILVDGVAGYYVITALKIAGSSRYILVNRGWVAQGTTRQELPSVSLPGGEVTLEGIVRTPSALPFVAASEEKLSMGKAFNLWLYPDLEKYAAESSYDILPFALMQTSNSEDGLLRDWPPYQAKVAMHIGYALQWFAFALIVSLMFWRHGRKAASEPEQVGSA